MHFFTSQFQQCEKLFLVAVPRLETSCYGQLAHAGKRPYFPFGPNHSGFLKRHWDLLRVPLAVANDDGLIFR
jgi:hypothetical protein